MRLPAFSFLWFILSILGAQAVNAPRAAAQPVAAAGDDRDEPPRTQGSLEPDETGEYRVDFSAGRVEVDVRLNELELSDDVLVVVDRYRLTADELKLGRSDRGIVVDGYGRVAFCRCADPPVTVSFSGATVAPPTDLLIEAPTLRVFGLPVMWLPYLWLRSPDRMGLLPPRVAYSSEDGFLAGAGIHLPFAGGSSFIDLEVAGYFRGGVDARVRLQTPNNALRVRWDHLEQSMIGVDARGAVHVPGLSNAAYRIDALRGKRSLQATPILLEAAQRYDRVRGEVGRHHGQIYYGVGAFGTATRGGAMDSWDAWGPTVSFGGGEALGGAGEFELGGKLISLDGEDETLTRFEQRLLSRWHARPGPLAMELELGGVAGLTSSTSEASGFGSVAGRAEVGLPLRRRFGGNDPLLHYLTPIVTGSVERVVAEDPEQPTPDDERTFKHVAMGARTSLGRWGRRSGLEVDLRAGWSGTEASARPLAGGTLLTQSVRVAASLQAVAQLERSEGWVAIARGRLGAESSHHLTLYVEGQRNLDARLARMMSGDVLTNTPWLDWYDADGLTSGADFMLRWSQAVSTAVGGDLDMEHSQVLSLRGSLAYRHPCGCLATVAWAGHRLARRGVDAWLTVDLIP